MRPNPPLNKEKAWGQVQGKHHETQDTWNSRLSCRKHDQGLNAGQLFHKIVSIVQL